MAIEDAVTELAAEKAQRLPQGPTGVRRVELRPKQRNDGIAAGPGSVNGEIGEKGEALRLSEDRVDRASVGPLQVQRPQHAQLDHAATAAASAPTGGGQVTLQSRLGHWPALASSMYAPRRCPPESFRVRSGRLARGDANCRARWRFTCQTSHAFPSWLWWASLPPRSHAETRRHRERLPKRESRSEEHTSELQSPCNLVCRLLLEKKKKVFR